MASSLRRSSVRAKSKFSSEVMDTYAADEEEIFWSP